MNEALPVHRKENSSRAKKAFRTGAAFILTMAVFVVFDPFAVYDYGETCTRCLCHQSRSQQCIFGIPLWRYSPGPRQPGYSADYALIFGYPCEHLFKKGGFGYRGGDGITGEGVLFQRRHNALGSVYQAYRRTGDRQLAVETITLIEKLFPEQTTVKAYYAERHRGIEDPRPPILFQLCHYLNLVETSDEWAQTYECSVHGFTTEPPFTKDSAILHAKLQSPSEIVQTAAASALKSVEATR